MVRPDRGKRGASMTIRKHYALKTRKPVTKPRFQFDQDASIAIVLPDIPADEYRIIRGFTGHYEIVSLTLTTAQLETAVTAAGLHHRGAYYVNEFSMLGARTEPMPYSDHCDACKAVPCPCHVCVAHRNA